MLLENGHGTVARARSDQERRCEGEDRPVTALPPALTFDKEGVLEVRDHGEASL